MIAQIGAGNSLVVKTLPGTGGTQTIVNAVGALIAQNKRVLVVSPRRLSLRGIARRLTDVGLPGVAVSPPTLRRDLIQSIGRNEKARQPHVADVDEALVRLRGVLLDYRGSLRRVDPVLKVSVLDALRELARLELLQTPPATKARLDRHALEGLHPAAARPRRRSARPPRWVSSVTAPTTRPGTAPRSPRRTTPIARTSWPSDFTPPIFPSCSPGPGS